MQTNSFFTCSCAYSVNLDIGWPGSKVTVPTGTAKAPPLTESVPHFIHNSPTAELNFILSNIDIERRKKTIRRQTLNLELA